MRWSKLSSTVVAAGVALAGCGGSSGDDFVAKAEKACRDGHAKLVAANPIPGDAGLRAQADAFDGMAVALRKIKAPSAKQASFSQLISDFSTAAGAERAAATTPSGDKARLAVELAAEQKAFASVRTDGAAAGLPTCSQQVTTGSAAPSATGSAAPPGTPTP